MGDAGASVNDTANAVNTASAAAGGAASAGVAAVAAAGNALVASITNMLDSVFANIDQAIARTKTWNDDTHHHHHHSDGSGGSADRYVTGDTNWDTYDLPTLVSMVAAPASPSQVQSVAGLWRSNGASITSGADNLSQSLTTLMSYWQGAASQQVSASVANTAGWITAVGETAGKVADQVENASGALASAQNTMPGAPTSTFWTAYNTAADGATAGTAGGPFGVAAGTMMGSLASVFVASNNNGTEKQQAVQTMQRFEQAGVNIDTTTPQFTAPPVWGSAGGTSSGGGLGPALTVTAPQPQGGQTTGVNLSTVPSFADSSTGRWDGLTGGPGGAGDAGVSAHDGGFAGFGMFGGGGGGFGKGNETERASVPTIQPGNAPAGAGAAAGAGENPAGIVGRTTDSAAMGSSVMEEVDARAAGGGGMMGSPMGAGMMGAGARGGGSEEEFRRRIPYEEDPFITGLKAVPPVIGLNSTEGDR